MDGKTSEDQLIKINQKINRLNRKKSRLLHKMKIPTYYGKPDKYIFWDYGMWVEKNCAFRHSNPTTYSQLQDNITDLLCAFGFDGDYSVISDIYNEKYYISGKNISAYGRAVMFLIKSDIISVPFKNPVFKEEMKGNLAFLDEYAKQAREN